MSGMRRRATRGGENSHLAARGRAQVRDPTNAGAPAFARVGRSPAHSAKAGVYIGTGLKRFSSAQFRTTKALLGRITPEQAGEMA